MKLLKWLFGNKEKNDPTKIHSITCGERDENGFADTYVYGEKTNVRILLWSKEEIDKVHEILDKLHKESYNKNKKGGKY